MCNLLLEGSVEEEDARLPPVTMFLAEVACTGRSALDFSHVVQERYASEAHRTLDGWE